MKTIKIEVKLSQEEINVLKLIITPEDVLDYKLLDQDAYQSLFDKGVFLNVDNVGRRKTVCWLSELGKEIFKKI